MTSPGPCRTAARTQPCPGRSTRRSDARSVASLSQPSQKIQDKMLGRCAKIFTKITFCIKIIKIQWTVLQSHGV
jgi:hypothetical protein